MKSKKEEWGTPKLCINRVPAPWDNDFFYVAAMKCIPYWENCDKCMCGRGKDPKCYFKGHKESQPDDDRVRVKCKKLKNIKFGDEKLNLKKLRKKNTDSDWIF